ncbi:MAG: single-stranded DNA-binding protein [Candidatus Saganbacteria bacterium]|nr:single-stranded DNA-binding protein [Candidatus Saganbacteria bacterium]
MYNKAFLIGNLTRDPELRYTTSGIPVARFAIAVNRFRRKSEAAAGEETRQQDVDFINIVAWRRLAEICGEYLKKGRPVAVEGRLQIRSYTGKDGQKKTMAEVVADNMQMLGGKRDESAESRKPIAESGTQEAETADDEIPF